MKTFLLASACLLLASGVSLPAVANSSISLMSVRPDSLARYQEHGTNASLIGRGVDQALFTFTLPTSTGATLESVTIDLHGTSRLKDVRSLKLYRTKNKDRFDSRTPGELLTASAVKRSARIKLALSTPKAVTPEDALWVVCDVAPSAKEGGEVVSRLSALKTSGYSLSALPEAKEHRHGIVLQRSLVWAPGEGGSLHYRIPGIIRLSDGTLIASIDRRKKNVNDLPGDIDVEVKRSIDNGKTWSAPITVARGTAEHGYGDAAMATDGHTIYMVMVGGTGLWHYPSRSKLPIQMYFTKSTDGGRTWATVTNITQSIYGDRFKYGGFFASGNGIITSTGRIIFVAAIRTEEAWGGRADNVLTYSDDQGKTWHSSATARINGDESKIVELSDGSLLVSCRNRAGGLNARTYVHSIDGGKTWSEPKQWGELMGNACNGGFARYAPVGSKKNAHLLLHTLPASATRDHLKLFLSEDEGKTWPYSREICRGESVYSELVIFPDGTIGIISEEDDNPGFDIYFTRVSLDWLRKGDVVRTK